MEKSERKLFKGFIEQLPNETFEEDPDVKDVDAALAYWVQKKNLQNFVLHHERRDLIISILKKSPKIKEMIAASPFKDYLDCLLDLIWRRTWEKWQKKIEEAQESKKEIDGYAILMELLREAIATGYCLKSLENDKKKEKKKRPLK